ncbi:Non-reducing end alpha-L-arabinofuranosidase [Paramyrothecium foliicola]|nr:Non-reducing end alpha-L-arabinofuranosidase [Paramyrothecium foliicola]
MGSVAKDLVYSNPIVPGFAPDPSVVFVDGTFFLCTSSFHVFPGLPIYASRNLQEWTHIGNALNRHSQLSLQNANTVHLPLDTGFSMVGTTGIVAPSIHHHKGIFYIVTTNTTVEGEKYETKNFIISCKDIWSNEWSDPVYFEFNGIDTSLFFDDDDRVYVQGSWMLRRDKQPTCTIKQAEIEISTGALLSETREIWPGWAKYDTEGPHIYKVGGYYYLMAAEGGTFEHHMLTISRSRDIWGPYESWEQNPIMTADGTDEYIQNIGHGELFQDGDGRWWAAVLGVRKHSDGTLGLGRESFLSPVDWPEGGWPTVRQPRMRFTRESVPSLISKTPIQAPPFVEDLYIRDHDEKKYHYSSDKSKLSLVPSHAGLDSPEESCTFLGRRQRFLTGLARTRLEASQNLLGKNIKAGLALYKDPIRFASVSYNFADSTVVFEVHNSAKGLVGTIARKFSLESDLDLRIVASPARYTFEARQVSKEADRASEKDWVEIGCMEAKALDARDFTGPILGVFAQRISGETGDEAVSFDDFGLKSQPPTEDGSSHGGTIG